MQDAHPEKIGVQSHDSMLQIEFFQVGTIFDTYIHSVRVLHATRELQAFRHCDRHV